LCAKYERPQNQKIESSLEECNAVLRLLGGHSTQIYAYLGRRSTQAVSSHEFCGTQSGA
jgi:hypothetical protein